MSPIRPLWHASIGLPEGTRPVPGLPRTAGGIAYTAATYAVEVTARLRPELAGLPVYVPGKTVPGAIKLASNETVFGPLPSVRAAIERATDIINRYPDNGCVQLKAALAKHLGSDFAPEHVAVGCGSVSLCQQLVQITASAGDEVIFGWRSFELYPPQVQVAGATAVKVPLTDHTFDLDAMLAAVTDRTRLIFVCNPNNPTSTVVDPDALARFVEAVPPHILIAIDEAYVEYIRDGMAPDSLGAGPRAQQCRCAAHLFEGVRAGGPARRLRDRPPRADHRAGQGLRAVHRDQRLAGRRHRLAGRRRRAAGPHRRRWSPNAPGSAPGLRDAGFTRAADAGQLRLAAAGPAHTGLRRAGRRARGSSSARTAPTVCGSPSGRRKKTTPCCDFARDWITDRITKE